METVALLWSGGKDSALSLYELREQGYSVNCLVTTYDPLTQEVGMHKVPIHLIVAQACSLGIPLLPVAVPFEANLEVYNCALQEALVRLQKQKINIIASGDIFLEDLREYKENLIEQVGLKAVFPLWQWNSQKICEKLRSLGFLSLIVCVNLRYLPKEVLGKNLEDIFENLPDNVDKAGERGEFHTFVYQNPNFNQNIIRYTAEGVLEFNYSYFAPQWDTQFAYFKIR